MNKLTLTSNKHYEQLILRYLLILLFIPTISIAQNIQGVGSDDESVLVISKEQAINDLNQLKEILEKHSSYLDLKGFNYAAELDKISTELPEVVNVAELALILEKYIGSIGDRHARVKPPGDRLNIEKYLPFTVAPLDGNVVALIEDKKTENQYSFFFDKYPYLKAIEGIPVSDILENNSWRHAYAPKDSKLFWAVRDLRYLGVQFYKLKKQLPEKISFTFTNGKKDKTVSLAPIDKRLRSWNYKSEWEIKKDTAILLDPKIGYFKIAAMFSPHRSPEFFEGLPQRMKEFESTNALIIDIRNNGGGTRDILNAFAPYFLSSEDQPWVANIAKVRCDQNFDEDMESMTGRYLFSYGSDHLSDKDMESIDNYMEGYEPEWKYDASKYTGWFYMVLSHDRGNDHFYYNKPVYVLVNELSFSAASVFTTALKGMGKVKIVGVTTDGSSGRSNYFDLKHSKINIKLSTMISFQRNGKTLDTNGTEPDVYIPRKIEQILGQEDSQLNELIQLITKNNNK